MRTRLRRSPIPRRAQRPDTSRGCWSMVLIDGEPIRKKARKNYDKVLRDLAKCKEEIERFEAEDHPRFMRWFNSTFGALITQTRELHQRLARARALVNEVQQEHFFGGHRSIHQAYQRVMRRVEEEENAPPPEPPPGGHAGGSAEEDEEEFFRKQEEAFREFASAFGFDPGEEFAPSRKQKEPDRSPRLKELYRAVVRRLHPDKAGKLSPKEVEWWHQAQDAYESQNIEQLELILTLCEIEDRGTKETSVSLLGQIVAHFKSSLRALKRQLTQCKRDPAWNFSKLADYTELQRQGERTFKTQVETLLIEVVHYETLLEKWKHQAANPTRARRPRSREFIEEEFLF